MPRRTALHPPNRWLIFRNSSKPAARTTGSVPCRSMISGSSGSKLLFGTNTPTGARILR